jgi:imidazolonepropionase-like amidohydrolase
LRVGYSLLLFAALSAASLAQTKDVAITGAKIELGDGKVIASGTVVIHDGKIASIGDNVQVPPGAEVIDAKGKTLYPGFIDAYSTRGLKLPDAPAAGTPPDSRTTAPATMWHGNRKGIRADILASKCLDFKDQLNANYAQGIITALLAPGGGTIRGFATIVDYTDPGFVLVPNAAGELAIRGGGFGGGGGAPPSTAPPTGDTGYPGSLLGIIAVARQFLVDAQEYALNGPATKDGGFENMKPLMSKQIPAIFFADTDREIVRSGQIADEFGLKSMYAGAHEAFKQIDYLKAKGIPVLASVDVGAEPPMKATAESDTPQAVLDERHQTWVDRSQNIKLLLAAGIPVAFSSAGANLGDYLKNVRKIIAMGVPRDAALRCMTSDAAAILGISDQLGTIELGKRANLVLMNGDFANEATQVETVFVGGTKVDVKKGTD